MWKAKEENIKLLRNLTTQVKLLAKSKMFKNATCWEFS